jgi:high-affinity K+ transport system ATPase subunit B
MNNEEKNFGVPEVDNSPVGIVGMEGRLFRGMTGNKTPRSRGLRLAIIIFSIFLLLIPGLWVVGLMIMAYPDMIKGGDANLVVMIVPTLIGLVLIGCGIAGIKANLKK